MYHLVIRLLDARADSTSPALDARVLATELYGLELTEPPRRLHGTGADIFLLSAGRRYTLQISPAEETSENLASQNDVLTLLAHRQLDFQLPEVVPSLAGRLTELVRTPRGTRLVRLLSYVSGQPASTIDRTRALLEDVGRSLALLDLHLADGDICPPSQDLIWSVPTALRLQPLTESIADGRARAVAQLAFSNFEQLVLPSLSRVRNQLIHNDFNAENVLVEPGQPDRVAGVIDFGDLTVGPLINDLAVAAASHADPEDPVPGILAVSAGFTSALTLLREEAQLLFHLIALRPAMRLAVWSARAADTAQPLSPSIEQPCTAMLRALMETDARTRITSAVGR